MSITYPPEMLPTPNEDEECDVVVCDESGNIVQVIEHPNKKPIPSAS